MSSIQAIQPRSGPSFPRAPLFAATALIIMTIGFAAVGRLTHAFDVIPTAQPVAALNLKFVDRADGGVNVFNADTNGLIDEIMPESNGFLRATVRGFAQQRRREDTGPAIPFRLTRWADGRLTLLDPATGRGVELEAFGQTNEEAFAKLLIDGTRHS
jgi:putative photosynthetic complex assembly protein